MTRIVVGNVPLGTTQEQLVSFLTFNNPSFVNFVYLHWPPQSPTMWAVVDFGQSDQAHYWATRTEGSVFNGATVC
jgi:hypothetical protein